MDSILRAALPVLLVAPAHTYAPSAAGAHVRPASRRRSFGATASQAASLEPTLSALALSKVDVIGEKTIIATVEVFDTIERRIQAINAWPASRAHDIFNIFSISGLVALTCAALLNSALNSALAIAMLCYTVVDTIWLASQPAVFETPWQILGHHLACIVIAFHAATFAPHTRFTCWMGVVELSTLLLLLKGYASSDRAKAWLEVGFKVTWVVSRCLWFPILAVYLSALPDWPSVVRRVVCGGCTFGLVLLQWLWTIQAARGKRPSVHKVADA